MNEHKTSLPDSPQDVAAHAEFGVSRRRLIRAGLSAAPVVAAFKSNTVLATTTGSYNGGCIKPSAFASFQANGHLSKFDNDLHGCYCRKPEHWRDYEKDRCKSMTLSSCGLHNGSKVKCSDRKWSGYSDHNLWDVLNLDNSGDRELAKYVIACYLSSKYLPNAPLSVDQCQKIWAGSGVWMPISGSQEQWTKAFTLDYLKKICV